MLSDSIACHLCKWWLPSCGRNNILTSSTIIKGSHTHTHTLTFPEKATHKGPTYGSALQFMKQQDDVPSVQLSICKRVTTSKKKVLTSRLNKAFALFSDFPICLLVAEENNPPDAHLATAITQCRPSESLHKPSHSTDTCTCVSGQPHCCSPRPDLQCRGRLSARIRPLSDNTANKSWPTFSANTFHQQTKGKERKSEDKI